LRTAIHKQTRVVSTFLFQQTRTEAKSVRLMAGHLKAVSWLRNLASAVFGVGSSQCVAVRR